MGRVSEIAGRLRARRPEIEHTISERLGATFDPGLTLEAPTEYLDAQRAALAAIVEYGLGGVEQGDGWEGQVPSAAVAHARYAARLGVPHETVLRHCVAVHTQLEDHVMEEAESAGLPGHSAALRGIHTTQGLMLGHLIAAIADAYAKEERLARRSPEQRRLDRVRRLLAGERLSMADHGYELGTWHLAVIAIDEEATQALRKLTGHLARYALHVRVSERTTWAWLGGPRRLTFADVTRVLSALACSRVSLAVGEPASGFDGFRLTHRQAQAAATVALRQPRIPTRFADVALLAPWLKDDGMARSLVEMYLSPLDQAGDGSVLRETLREYIAAERNASAAAAALGVDRGTVGKRLQAIRHLGCPMDRMAELEVITRLAELREASPQEADKDPRAARPRGADQPNGRGNGQTPL